MKEIHRLRALRSIKPNESDEEIEYIQRQLEAVSRALASARLRLDALRVVVTT